MPKPHAPAASPIHFAGRSAAGAVRSINQDSYYVGKLEHGAVLAIVADGMGGHRTGEIASQKAVETVRQALQQRYNAPPAAIARAVQEANLLIYDTAQENPECRGMGTTLTSVFIDDQIAIIAHVGDSRAYLLRQDKLRQLTQDHSWVADRVRQGILTSEEARQHRWRNVITNALGARTTFRLDLFHLDMRPQDRLLLCSDGISMLFHEEELRTILGSYPPEEAVDVLMARADERGSPDNITAIVLALEDVIPKRKNYSLPESFYDSPASVNIGETMSGVESIEQSYAMQDAMSKLQRQAWYPYRLWIIGCLYLLLLFLFFSLR